METGLTEKDRTILQFVADFTSKNGGPPSLKEIGDEIGMSKSNAFTHIDHLIGRGLVFKRPKVARGIMITDAGRLALKEPTP